MATTMEQMRAWQGPAVLSYGFRPFFFGAGLLAALLIALWVPWYLGFIRVPSAFAPLNWHIHELLFGYVPGVIAGFLLTAVPNWTGRLPVVGWPLGALFALWLGGRAIVAFSAGLAPDLVAGVTIAFPLALGLLLAREVVAGRNWRNLKVLVALGALILAQGFFHYEIATFGRAEISTRLGIAATMMLIMIIGGRIVPSFTRNWIKRANPGREPREFGRYDLAAMLLGGIALAGWIAAPRLPGLAAPIGAALAAAALVHLWRLLRWAPDRTWREPLVMVLHVAYAFVPLGFGLAAIAVLGDDPGWHQAAIHAWTSGGIGLMTLAVMTRASRGHSGRPLTAPLGTVLVYAAITAAALLRIAAALLPEEMLVLLGLSGLSWCLGFLGFALLYARILLWPPLR
jgi:uncharacterized protein involved in response to NO